MSKGAEGAEAQGGISVSFSSRKGAKLVGECFVSYAVVLDVRWWRALRRGEGFLCFLHTEAQSFTEARRAARYSQTTLSPLAVR